MDTAVSPDQILYMNTSANVSLGLGMLVGTVGVIIYIAIIVLMIVSRRKIFKKAGLPGRGSLIPIYNMVLMFKLAGRSGRWTLSILFPPLLLVMFIVACFDRAKRFGKGVGFGFGLRLLGIVFIPILAFGKSTYTPKA